MSKYIIISFILLVLLFTGCSKEKSIIKEGANFKNIKQSAKKQIDEDPYESKIIDYNTPDGIAIKNALLDYMQKSGDELYKKLIIDIQTVQPYEYEMAGKRYVGVSSWQYSYDDNSLEYKVPIQGPGGLWFFADITKENDNWVVRDIKMMEVFR